MMELHMKTSRLLVPIVLSLFLIGCGSTYSLVQPGPNSVAKKSMVVQPATAWNRIPKNKDQPWEESWTLNGPLLDTVAFVGGVPDGKALVRQNRKVGAQVPTFRSDMSPDDLVSMIEGSYRVGGVSAFETGEVVPVKFLGTNAIRMDFSYVPGDKLPRKGRCVMGVVDNKLYLMKLEGAASHYFDAAIPQFESMLSSATLR
jgi:hypothetical protein